MSAPAFDVIVCGSLHLDIMLYAPSLPRPGRDGSGHALGAAMRRQGRKSGGHVRAGRGARTAMIGRIGADDFGDRLRENLNAAHVDSRAVLVDADAGSGMSAAIVRDDGDYGAVIVSGANLLIPPESVEPQWRALGGARVLVLQNEVPEAVNVAAAKVARGAGAIVIFNAAPARATSRRTPRPDRHSGRQPGRGGNAVGGTGRRSRRSAEGRCRGSRKLRAAWW